MNSLFKFSDYKAYLRSLSGAKGTRNGFRSQLAQNSGCTLTYVSQVLNGDREFSLEQAQNVSRFLRHTPEESHYFLLLVQKRRAGTKDLRTYFDHQINEIIEKRMNIKSRLGVRDHLSKENQAVYYSAWYFAAVHVAVSVSHLQTRESLADYFSLTLTKTDEILEFLVAAGLAVAKNGRYSIGPSVIHLGKESTNIIRHHSNWRTRALVALEKDQPSDIHYSAAVTLSLADAVKIKDSLIETIEARASVIGASKEEEVYCLTMDFFSLCNKV